MEYKLSKLFLFTILLFSVLYYVVFALRLILLHIRIFTKLFRQDFSSFVSTNEFKATVVLSSEEKSLGNSSVNICRRIEL